MQRPLQNDFGVGDKEISREGSGAPSTPQDTGQSFFVRQVYESTADSICTCLSNMSLS